MSHSKVAQARIYRVHIRTPKGESEKYRLCGPDTTDEATNLIHVKVPGATVIHALLIAKPGEPIPDFLEGERDLGQFPGVAPRAIPLETSAVATELECVITRLTEVLGFAPTPEQAIRHLIHHFNQEEHAHDCQEDRSRDQG